MIESLDIIDFQSHAKSHLDFGPGVNLIMGKSDSGKTAIIRAINWIVNNKPAGDRYRRTGSKKTTVCMALNNETIEKVRDDKLNEYRAGTTQYKALGQAVPDDISKKINFSEVNIQYQMDSPFLLSQSSGEVARYFNKVVNLEEIDESMKKAASAVRDLNSQISNQEGELGQAREKLETLSWIDKAKESLKGLQKLSGEETKVRKEYTGLSDIISQITKASEALLDIKFDKAEEDIKKLLSASSKEEELQEKIMVLTESIEALNELDFQEINFSDAETKLEALKDTSNKIEEVKESITGLQQIIKEENSCSSDISEYQEQIKDIETELEDIMPDVCPLCGQEIKHG
jgi:DNA repair exonuclease SbcCD ATPase subunit